MKQLSQVKISQVINLRKQGLPYQDIANELEVSRSSVGRICRKYVPDLRTIAHYKIDEDTISNITRLRRLGYKYEYISMKTGVSVSFILKICNKLCPGTNYIAHHKRIDKNIQRRICYLYDSGLSIKDVMKELQLGYKAVHNSLLRNSFVQKRGGRLIRHS